LGQGIGRHWKIKIEEQGGSRLRREWINIFHRNDPDRTNKIKVSDLRTHEHKLGIGACDGDEERLKQLRDLVEDAKRQENRADELVEFVPSVGFAASSEGKISLPNSPNKRGSRPQSAVKHRPKDPSSSGMTPNFKIDPLLCKDIRYNRCPSPSPSTASTCYPSTTPMPGSGRTSPVWDYTATSHTDEGALRNEEEDEEEEEEEQRRELATTAMACPGWFPSASVSIGLVGSSTTFRGQLLVHQVIGHSSKLRGSGISWCSDGRLLAHFPTNRTDEHGWNWTGRSSPYHIGDIVEIVASPLPDDGSVKLFLNGKEVPGFPEGILQRSPSWRLATKLERSRVRLIQDESQPFLSSASAPPRASSTPGRPGKILMQGYEHPPPPPERAVVGLVGTHAQHWGFHDPDVEVAARPLPKPEKVKIPLSFRLPRRVIDAPLRLEVPVHHEAIRESRWRQEASSARSEQKNAEELRKRISQNRHARMKAHPPAHLLFQG